jgi:hypothetical protein
MAQSCSGVSQNTVVVADGRLTGVGNGPDECLGSGAEAADAALQACDQLVAMQPLQDADGGSCASQLALVVVEETMGLILPLGGQGRR